MSETATTTLSSKGQVVIPEEIRVRLGLKADARRAAKQAGVKPADVAKAIAKVRRAK